jgi:hypothetical protein
VSCSPRAAFARAVDAVERGDVETLERELDSNPPLATGGADGARLAVASPATSDRAL